MPDSQLELPVPAHRNSQLFSDHYLNFILPEQAGWQALAAQPQMAWIEIADIFNKFVPSANERQTEENLICPILMALGHIFEVQAPLKTPFGTKVPDYVFYCDKEAQKAHKNQVLTEAVAHEGAYAIGDAKYWNRPLDVSLRTSGADLESNKNPSYQIALYMQHSGVEWGILTNGKLWRLYHRDTAYKMEIFYEVDLEELIHSPNPEHFLYFYAFFRREAFDPGTLCLSEMLRASIDYALGVSNSLKLQVYDALRCLAQGFLDNPKNGLSTTPEDLKDIYDNSLIVLYRLIFILYAEARELLPMRESNIYRDGYSLWSIKNRVARDLKYGTKLLPESNMLWSQLKILFGAINQGSPPLKVATFNGGLFDPVKHPFLEQYQVGDANLQQAIDKLARVDGKFIDYRDLSVRHMGTIYEGLLEFKLIPCDAADGWAVDLVNDKGERKATGSYYTPDYIVKFIVEQTVGPALWETVTGKATNAEIINAVLAVNVLDPAMGSGHFLVEATEFISRFLVDYDILPEGKTAEEADIAYWKRRVVQSCIYGVDLNPLAVELAKLSLWLVTVAKNRPLSFLDHHLRPGNSLVGASLEELQNPYAIATNGAKKNGSNGQQESLFNTAEFATLMSIAVNKMWSIEESEAENVTQVKEQEQLYTELRHQLVDKYGKLADLICARHFGINVVNGEWTGLVSALLGNSMTDMAALQELLQQAEGIATREHFFHWELEFPEIYFDRFGRPLYDDGGFDVVVGNPPYVRQEQLAAYKPYFELNYPEVYHGVADLFVYFFAQGLRKARENGWLSYISSNSWLRANYATPLRHHLREETTIEMLVDIGDNRVFAEAPDVYPAVHIVRKSVPSVENNAQVAVFTRGEGIANFTAQVPEKLFSVSMHDQDDSGWQLVADVDRDLFRKLMSIGKPLGEVVEGRMYRGILTGLNEAFYIDKNKREQLISIDPQCSEVIKHILRGEDLRSWYQENEGRWLITIPNGWTQENFGKGLSEADAWQLFTKKYPSVATHLYGFIEAAQKRWDKGEYWWELRSCDYYDTLGELKIVWPTISKYPRFSMDNSGSFINDASFCCIPDDIALLGYLQSRVAWYGVLNICIALGERAGSNRYQLKSQFMNRLPVPKMNDSDREAIGKLAMEITELARGRYELHQQMRERLSTDFGVPGKKLNNKLTACWELDFPALRAELQKVFKRDIPVSERDAWQKWLAAQSGDHTRLTREIISREIALNSRVYSLFNLTPDEIALIEKSTKYEYGEV
ncbi:MAG: N-6 DNA methylase [bacterium]